MTASPCNFLKRVGLNILNIERATRFRITHNFFFYVCESENRNQSWRKMKLVKANKIRSPESRDTGKNRVPTDTAREIALNGNENNNK